MQQDRGPMSRRALIAALAGGGAALATRLIGGAEVVSAVAPPVRLASTNSGYGDTVVRNTSTSTAARGLHGRARGSGVAGTSTVSGNTGALGQPSNGVFGQAFTANGNGMRGVANSGAAAYGVWGSASSGVGVMGHGTVGVAGTSFSGNGTGLRGVANSGATAAGVAGASISGYGVSGTGKVGVEGTTADGANFGRLGQLNTGVQGVSTANNGTGIMGRADSGTLAFGVWGRSSTGWAGYFSGDVQVTGTLGSSAAAFTVDHPQDPSGRLLSQAYVASDEMLSTYSGNVTTDAAGAAVVRLPGYVGALNGDFRYQLTVVGGFAQAIVAQKVRDGRFTIRTSEPGVEVSWQVSGVRRDAFARDHPFRAERAKKGALAGRFLRPDLHGRPDTQDVTATRRGPRGRRSARVTRPAIDRKLRAQEAADR